MTGRRSGGGSPPDSRLNAVVVADWDVVGLGIERAATDGGFDVVREAVGDGLIGLQGRTRTDLVVVAADAGTARRVSAAARALAPDTCIAMVVPLPDEVVIEHAIRLGSTSVIALGADAAFLTASLQAAATGVVLPEVPWRKCIGAQQAELDDADLEVLRLVAAGATNRDIAERLHLSATTAKSRVSRLLRKLQVISRAAAVARASELGLLTKLSQKDRRG